MDTGDEKRVGPKVHSPHEPKKFKYLPVRAKYLRKKGGEEGGEGGGKGEGERGKEGEYSGFIATKL